MKSTWRLFINIGFFSWNQPEAWNQPERDEINRNKKQVIFSIHCSMWLTSNHMFFGWFWEQNQPSVFNKILKSPSLCSGWFQNFGKNLGLIFSQITLKNMWLLVSYIKHMWSCDLPHILYILHQSVILIIWCSPSLYLENWRRWCRSDRASCAWRTTKGKLKLLTCIYSAHPIDLSIPFLL